MFHEEFQIGDLVTHGTYVLVDDPQKTVWVTRDGDLMYITTEYKGFQATLDANSELANSFSKNQKLGDMERVASIPLGVYHEWAKQGITEDENALKRRLNDADYGRFRTNSLRL